jgi:lipopolysaccharide assembly outer membrane protein LptD (OstA)
VRASVRETAYHLLEQTLDENGKVLPKDQSRELVQLDAEVGTSFSRVYPFQWLQLEKIRHTLEPALAYLYVPAVSQDDLPLFDGVDRVNHRNLLTYGLVSRFIGKFADAPPQVDDKSRIQLPSSVRELARFSVMQSFDVSREIQPLETARASDHFSDVDVDGRVNPSRIFSFRFHANYDTGNNDISAARVGFFAEDARDDTAADIAPRLGTRTSAGISYRFLTQNLLQEIDDNVVVHVTDWAGLLYSSRYDVVANHFLDNFFGLRLTSTCDCWALDFAVTDRSNPQEVEVRAQLTLAGLGSSRSERHAAAP